MKNNLLENFPSLCKEWSNKNQLSPNEYSYGSHKKVYWRCNQCNHTWLADIHSRTMSKNGCPACCSSPKVVTDKNRLSTKYPELIKEWDYNKNIIKPDNIAISTRKKAWWICSKCDLSFYTRISHRVNGTKCPKCNSSKGEERIEHILKSNNIKYERQFRIKECRSKNPLPFDFAIWINDKLKLIEYNGEQHYKTFLHFTNSTLKNQQERDLLKIKFCQNNNIELLIIKYTEYNNIENLINNFII